MAYNKIFPFARAHVSLWAYVSFGAVLIACSGEPIEDAAAPGTENEDPDGEEALSSCTVGESVGRSRVQVRSAADVSHCDGCGQSTEIKVRLPDGTIREVANGFLCGRTVCETCSPGDCLEIACFDYDTGNFDFVWDGWVNSASTCGEGVSCYEICFVPAGRYELIYCTTRGTLTEMSDSLDVCEKEVDPGGQPIRDCVTTEFDYPSEPDAAVQVIEIGPN